MLKDLKFVAGAVSRKNIVQALTHFRIENRTIRGFNGTIGLCSPIELDLDVTPHAEQLIRAVDACDGTIALHVTKSEKLSIKSGKFKSLVKCIPKVDFPEIMPEGDTVTLNGGFLDAIKKLNTFISDDASRIWSRGILFKGQSAFATNNICLAEYQLGYTFPCVVNIPKIAINELIRINEEPISLQVTENRVAFHFSGDRWLTTQTYQNEWPDISTAIATDGNFREVDPELANILEKMARFTEDDAIYFNNDGYISTLVDYSEGTSYEYAKVPGDSLFDYNQLLKILNVATHIDLSKYPALCPFYGDSVRGVILGRRHNGAPVRASNAE